MRETVKRIESTLTQHAQRLETHIAADQEVQVEAVRASSRIETKVEGLDEKIITIADDVAALRRRRPN